MGSLDSLETTLNSLQQRNLRPSMHTTHNIKWSRYTLTTLNISQLQTFIHAIENNGHGHTALHTVHHKHTTHSPHRNALRHLYTDDHRGQLIADVISNSAHITLNTNTPIREPNTTLQQTSSPDITTVSNTPYNRTSWTTHHALSSDHLLIITTINIRHDYRLQQN